MLKAIYILLSLIALIAIATFLFMQQAVIGKNPSGKRLDKILKSKNYRDGAFQNINPTPNFGEGYNLWKVFKLYLERGPTSPEKTLPSKKLIFDSTYSNDCRITWLGHSSYIIQVDGSTILVDPVIEGNASPHDYFGKAYVIDKPYTLNDLPAIDYLIITHDHYDHLDYKTILKLKDQVQHIYTSLGVGSHLEYWGVNPEKITELDWDENSNINNTLTLTACPARHFSGRGFKRNQTLWSSFVLKSKEKNMYLGGDSGYDTHFKEIGEKYGPFDLCILECGQYNKAWSYIHMMPNEVAQAAVDLKAELLLPVHWGKFTLALHPWSEPIELVKKFAEEKNINITTPMIGEPVIPGKVTPKSIWWK